MTKQMQGVWQNCGIILLKGNIEMNLRVALAQINATVGDLAGNRDKILAWLERASQLKADIVVF